MRRLVAFLLLLLLLPGTAVGKVGVPDYGARADGKTDDTAAVELEPDTVEGRKAGH